MDEAILTPSSMETGSAVRLRGNASALLLPASSADGVPPPGLALLTAWRRAAN
jgi:hypothetical protein